MWFLLFWSKKKDNTSFVSSRRSIDPLSKYFGQFAALPLLSSPASNSTSPRTISQRKHFIICDKIFMSYLWELFTIKSNQDTYLMNAFIYESKRRKEAESLQWIIYSSTQDQTEKHHKVHYDRMFYYHWCVHRFWFLILARFSWKFSIALIEGIGLSWVKSCSNLLKFFKDSAQDK